MWTCVSYDSLQNFSQKEVAMSVDLRKLALRLKVVEMLKYYSQAKRQTMMMRRWKKFLIHPN